VTDPSPARQALDLIEASGFTGYFCVLKDGLAQLHCRTADEARTALSIGTGWEYDEGDNYSWWKGVTATSSDIYAFTHTDEARTVTPQPVERAS
jgi:hypothetical protein